MLALCPNKPLGRKRYLSIDSSLDGEVSSYFYFFGRLEVIGQSSNDLLVSALATVSPAVGQTS
jgi:hypothetical protein